jgi:3-oxoacyl-[acyl-carrier-protein] synthase-3
VTAVVEGLGVHVPPRVVTNDDLGRTLDTNDAWIRKRTGIAQRRWADPGTTTADLAAEAGAKALKSAGGGDVDAVLVATMTPDRLCPATAPEVASRLGQPNVAAFDVGAVCSGFVYALATASGLIDGGIAARVLVIGAEVMSVFLDPEERSSTVLFGDGAGALVLRSGTPDEPGAVGPFDLGSDGDGADLIEIPAGGSRMPVPADRAARYFRQDGKEVYRRAIPGMVASSLRVLAKAGLEVADVDRLIGHQANARILVAVAEQLGVPPERCTINVDRYGNTSGATIPLAMADAGLVKGDRVLLTAFGAGLTWGSALLIWPELASA